MREASSLQIINDLVAAGAKIQAFDPVASETAAAEIPEKWITNGSVKILSDQYEALENAEALILVTEWKQFRNPDFDAIKQKLKQPVIFDGRNQYEPAQMKELGFTYSGIGRTL